MLSRYSRASSGATDRPSEYSTSTLPLSHPIAFFNQLLRVFDVSQLSWFIGGVENFRALRNSEVKFNDRFTFVKLSPFEDAVQGIMAAHEHLCPVGLCGKPSNHSSRQGNSPVIPWLSSILSGCWSMNIGTGRSFSAFPVTSRRCLLSTCCLHLHLLPLLTFLRFVRSLTCSILGHDSYGTAISKNVRDTVL